MCALPNFEFLKLEIFTYICASVAELVDAVDSKSTVLMDVSVQVGSEVPLLYLKITNLKMLNFIDLIKAIFLGVIEGLTEFIPVSSTAHLLVSSYLIDFSEGQKIII